MIQLSPWRRIVASFDKSVTKKFLARVGSEAVKIFRTEMRGQKSGNWYRRKKGRWHRASAPGEYPANDYGNLRPTIRSTSTANSVTVGSSARYSRWLREGTRYMARRNMSDTALEESVSRNRSSLKGFVKFGRR